MLSFNILAVILYNPTKIAHSITNGNETIFWHKCLDTAKCFLLLFYVTTSVISQKLIF